MQTGKLAKKAATAGTASVTAPVAAAAAVTASTASNAAAAPAVAEKRPVKVAPKAAASAPAPTPAPAPVAAVEVIAGDADDEETYKDFEFKGVKYYKNGLQYVYKQLSDKNVGDYVGRYDVPKRKIDTTVPEPPVED